MPLSRSSQNEHVGDLISQSSRLLSPPKELLAPHLQAPASHYQHSQAKDTESMSYSCLQMLRCLMQQPTAIRCSVRLYGLRHKNVDTEILAEAAAETLAGRQALALAAVPILMQGCPPLTHSPVTALNCITDQTCTAGHQGIMTDLQAGMKAMPIIMLIQQLPTKTGTTDMRDNQVLVGLMHKHMKCIVMALTQMQEHRITDTMVADLTAQGNMTVGSPGSTVTGRVTHMTLEVTKRTAESLTAKMTAGITGKTIGDHTGLMTGGTAEGKRGIMAVTDRMTGAVV